MERRAARAAAALLCGAAAAGCCGLVRAAPGTRGDRDTPERAFAFVRDAFAEDRTGDQYDSFHPDFREAQGITASRYEMARTLRPGLFEEAADLLRDARIAGPPDRGTVATKAGPRAGARIALEAPGGGRGVFVLADEPSLLLVTDDPDLPEVRVSGPELAAAMRVDGGDLVLALRSRLLIPPRSGSTVLRVEIHHDWLLLGIESLEGFGEFLEEVRRTAEESKEESPR